MKTRRTIKVLNSGEWEALLAGVPDQYRPLIIRLAVFHKAIEPPRPGETCAACGAKKVA
jgi:hypothetical protein